MQQGRRGREDCVQLDSKELPAGRPSIKRTAVGAPPRVELKHEDSKRIRVHGGGDARPGVQQLGRQVGGGPRSVDVDGAVSLVQDLGEAEVSQLGVF
jgi:hypothetical protein